MKKRIISIFLAIVMLVGVIPVTAYAEYEDRATEVDPGEVSIEGTNGFGTLLSAELTRSQEDAAQEQSEYETGYTVTALTIEGNQATVEYSTQETAVLMVALYSEDGLLLMASGQAVVSAEENLATVTIEGDIPEYFQAIAYLMDTYDLSPLCPAYNTPLYTQAMQELLASTADDYEEDRVLNLDEDGTTNFAVYADETIVIEERENINTILSVDEETSTYVIGNADTKVTSLSVGDVFVYPHGEEDILIIKVAEIFVDGDTVTIIGGDDLELEDVFAAVKIEGESGSEDVTVDDSTADEGITYLGEETDGDVSLFAWEGGDETTASKKFKIDAKTDGNTGGNGVSASITVSGSLNLQLQVRVKYYLSMKTQYVEFKVAPTADFALEVSGKVTLAKKLGNLGVSPVPGVYVGFEPQLQAQFTGKVSAHLTIFMVIGFQYDNTNGVQNISSSPDVDLKVKVDGTIFLGIDFCPKVTILGDSVAKIAVNMLAGAEIKATTSGYMYEVYEKDAPSRHQCRECVAMEIDGVAKIVGTLKILNQEWLTVKITIGEWTAPLGEMYYSVDHDKFDSGTCPYFTYRVTVELMDAEGWVVPDWNVAVSTLSEPLTTNEHGVAAFYARPGTISFKAEKDGYYASDSERITSAQKINLNMIFDVDPSGGGSDDSNPDSDWAPEGPVLGGVLGGIESSEIVDLGLPIDHGRCGEKVRWALYRNGLLKISGSGAMKDYSRYVIGGISYHTPWYNQRNNITAVVIQDGVTYIGAHAFYNCRKVTSIMIPNSVTSIGDYAFEDCENLTDVTIPSSVTAIGEEAFKYCDNLTSVSMPDSIAVIGPWAFCGCKSLASIVIPDRVISINNGTFNQCESLASVTIPDSVTTIGDHAFSLCNSLTSVTIPDSVTSIGDYAFDDCNNLTSVTIPDSVTSIGNCAFIYCNSLVSVTIPNSVTTIGEEAFYSCDSLTSVTIGDSVASIGSRAFVDCRELTGIYVDANNPNYSNDGRGVLFNKNKTQLVNSPGAISGTYTIPTSVTTIGDYAFDDCENLTDVTIPTSVTTIGKEAFNSCGSLTSVTIPTSVTIIGYYAFGFCDSLTEVNYGGTEEQWAAISINNGNNDLIEAYFGYATGSYYLADTNNGISAPKDEAVDVMQLQEALQDSEEPLIDEEDPLPDDKDPMQEEEEPFVDDAPFMDDASDNNMSLFAVYPGDYTTEDTGTYTLKTASFTNLVPEQQYILLALKSIDTDNPLSADNLLYIAQAEAPDDGALTFQYIQREAADMSYVMACGASNQNLNDAQITFPAMTADGTLRTVNPTVVYGGKTLTEGTDYVITGVADYTRGGDYICYIRGIYNYTGLVKCSYTVEQAKCSVRFDMASATFTLTNLTADTVDVQFVAAAYDSDGRMIVSSAVTQSLDGGGTAERSMVYPSGADVYQVKAFVLSPETLLPLCSTGT